MKNANIFISINKHFFSIWENGEKKIFFPFIKKNKKVERS